MSVQGGGFPYISLVLEVEPDVDRNVIEVRKWWQNPGLFSKFWSINEDKMSNVNHLGYV